MLSAISQYTTLVTTSGAQLCEIPANQFGEIIGTHLVRRMQICLEGDGRSPVVALPTGSTPLGVYQWWRDHPKVFEWSRANYVHLDEYVGAAQSDPGSYAYLLSREIFSPLLGDDRSPWRNVHLFNGTRDPQVEIADQDRFIRDHGGLDIAFLGIGAGPQWAHYRWYRWLGRESASLLASLEASVHIGFNETGTPFDSRTHVTPLHPKTRSRNGVDFSQAITMGLETILGAREIVLAAKGRDKRSAIDLTFNQAVTERIPASILQRGGAHVTVFVDPEANPFKRR